MASNIKSFTFIEPATYYSTSFINVPKNFNNTVKQNTSIIANKIVLVSTPVSPDFLQK
jgi:hypothetical protein